MANKISVIVDVAVDGANRALGSFKKSVADADGAAGKFRAGAASAFDSVKQNAGNLALAAGTALVAFGVQAVNAFQETALAAGELRDKLGLTAEEASRFIEVAGDMGINVADLESTIGRMNREAANAPEKFDAIGAAIVRNKDGTINTKDTFLSVVDALNKMPDAADRAKAGQELFGRSWMNIAEMVGEGAEGMQAALDSVETNKVIDDAEIEEARRYRDALDALKGVSEDLTIAVGSHLVPVVADLAEGLQLVIEKGKTLGGIIPTQVTKPVGMLADQVQRSLMPWKYYTDFFGQAAETTGTLGDLTGELTDEVEDNSAAVAEQANIMSDAEIAAGRVAAQVDELTDSFAELRDEISEENAYLDAADGFDKVRQAAFDAYTAAAEGSVDAEAKARDYQRAINDQQLEVLDLVEAIGDVPPETTAKIMAALDQGEVDEAERILERLARTRNAELLVFPKLVGALPNKTPFTVAAPGRASGGPVSAGGTYVVGEEGPELLQMGSQSGNVIPNGATIGGGGTNITINVTAGMGADGQQIGRQVASALESYYRSGGRRI
jgi:hypothetical protein